jgi:hypothetical protein
VTPRDREIYNFIDMVGLCTAQQVKEIFLPNVDITKTYQRLRVLVQEELIKIQKVGLNNYYYTKRKTSKKMLEHDTKTTELVGYLMKNGAEIIDFKRNKIIGRTLQDNIFTDGYIAYKIKIGDKKYKRHIVVEVQRSIQYKPRPNYGYLYSCLEKYNHDSIENGLRALSNSNKFKQLPPLVVITDIKDNTSTLLTTKLIKLPYERNDSWNILIK